MNPGETAAYAARMRALLPIMDAHARGEIIEYGDTARGWKEMPSPLWAAGAKKYRIKPQPRKFYGIVYCDGSVTAFADAETRDKHLTYSLKNGGSAVNLMEIL